VSASTATDEPSLRHAGREALSLALIDSRNRTLRLLSWFEEALAPAGPIVLPGDAMPPDWAAGHAAWLAEAWIARNPQRGLGPRCPAEGPRLASVEPRADAWFDPRLVPAAARAAAARPDAGTLRAYMLDTLETTLELLERSAEDDEALHFHRMALFHEDWRGEQLAALAQRLGVAVGLTVPDGVASRPELALPATRWRLGWAGGGFALDIERGEAEEPVPAFDIDAQPVSWAQFLPFVESGSYCQPRFWSEPGRAWRQQQEKQVPRYLRQCANGVWEQQRWGQWGPIDPMAPACHLSFFEAQAWCQWAGRRLPTEAEWIAASTQGGFVWGQVWEWTASPFAPFAGFTPHPYRDYSQPWFDGRPVLKGASTATAARMVHRQYRNYFTPERNDIFAGFRSVAI